MISGAISVFIIYLRTIPALLLNKTSGCRLLLIDVYIIIPSASAAFSRIVVEEFRPGINRGSYIITLGIIYGQVIFYNSELVFH